MSDSVTVTFRLPKLLMERVEEHTKREGFNKSEYLRDLIRKEDKRATAAAKRRKS